MDAGGARRFLRAGMDERDHRVVGAYRRALQRPCGRVLDAIAVDHADAVAGESRHPHQSDLCTAAPPRNSPDQMRDHLSHSSSAMAGSMRRYWNLLRGLSTARLAGTRLCALMISWPSRDRTKSASSRAASGCGARAATPMQLG